jgi:hypothetical protein
VISLFLHVFVCSIARCRRPWILFCRSAPSDLWEL